MKKFKRTLAIGLLVGVVMFSLPDVSLLGNPPGWNNGDYMSVLDEEI